MIKQFLIDNNVQFCSIHDIAKMTGATIRWAALLQHVPKFPKPYQMIGSGPIWLRTDIEEYICDEKLRYTRIGELCGINITPFVKGSSMKAVWALHRSEISDQKLKQVLQSLDWLEYYRGIARNPRV